MAHVVDASPEPVQIALNRVKNAVGAVKKDERNSQQGFSFRGIDAVVNACSSALNEHGIITVPRVLSEKYATVEIGRNRTPMGHVVLMVEYRFYGPAGDFIPATVVSEAMDSGDKAMAKAMSVAYRIALLQTLNLPTDEPDPDSTSYERSGEKAEKSILDERIELADLVRSASEAKSVESLRNVYKGALAKGVLQHEITIPSTGEKMTFEKYLLQRGDDLKFRDGTKSAE